MGISPSTTGARAGERERERERGRARASAGGPARAGGGGRSEAGPGPYARGMTTTEPEASAPVPSSPGTVVLAGCGDLGTEAGLRFVARGHRVVGLRRRPEVLPAQIEGVSTDLSVGCPPLPADTSVVVVALAAGSREPDAYRAAYVDGLRHVLDAVDALPAPARPRVLFVSSTAAWGEADAERTSGPLVDEAVPATGAGSATAPALLEAERLLHERTDDGVALRLSGIYGPGRERLIDQVRAGGAPRDPARVTNRIHRDDAAAALVHLALDVDEPPRLVTGTDDEPVPLAEVLRWLADELGVDDPTAGADVGAGEGKRLSNALLRSTGFRFEHPSWREGYRAVLSGRGVRHP